MPALYKKLPCKNYHAINQQVLDYIRSLNIIDSSTEFWNMINTLQFVKHTPLLQQWLAMQNLKIHSLAVTIGRNKNCCSIHTDTPPAVNKLSWPVLNTTNTFNRWFVPKVDNPSIHVNHLGGTSYLDIDQLTEIGRMEVVEPCIINAGIPHDVLINEPAVFPRIGLQCMLFQEPQL